MEDPLIPPGTANTGMARFAAGLAACIPALALLGWIFQVPVLRSILDHAIAMNPVTALGLLGAAAALALASRAPSRVDRPRQVLALVVSATGLVRLIQQAIGAMHGFDTLLFADQIATLTPQPRMALGTAVSLLFLGAGLAFYQPRLRRLPRARWLLLPAGLIAALAIAGYLYQSSAFFDLPRLSPMALNTALTLVLLVFGATALPPEMPPMSSLRAPGLSGQLARWLLPAALLIPLGLGWLRVIGERAGWFDLPFGTAALAVVSAAMLSALVLFCVHLVRRTEAAQRNLTQAIQSSERRLNQILETMPVGVFVVDREGKPQYVNQLAVRTLGRGLLDTTKLAEQYAVYRGGTDTLYPDAELPVLRALRGEQVYAADLEIHRPDGVVPLEVFAAPVLGADGTPEAAIAAFSDITQRVEAERQIEMLNDELSQQVEELSAVNRELETFSYSVSHDLRAPLRAVDGFSRILMEDHAARLEPEAQRLLGRIRHNVRRMGNLIDDLLQFSRLSRKEMEPVPVDMDRLVQAVLDDLVRSSAPQVTLTVETLPPAVGDADLLRQVWTNLVQNAIKYSGKRPDPALAVGAAQEAGMVRYWIRDNGVGFDMAYADKLFGVFQRLHSPEEFEGTGVGLAIVQRIVHRHGGQVGAESSPGQGATFWFTLPGGVDDQAR